MAEQEQDVDALKRRGRRRLVGAVALVLVAVIVLPMVFDPEPRAPSTPVSVRIPGENDTPFKPKPPPVLGEPVKEAPKPAEKPAEMPVEKQELAKPTAPKASEGERERAEAALKGGEQYFVPVGAFSDPGSVIARLAEAKVPYYTEELAIAKGKVTRVRAGPFASKDAAHKAVDRLKSLGFKPGNVAAKG